MKSKWITHQGTQVFYVDFSDFERDLDGLKAEFEAVTTMMEQQQKSSVLVLADLYNTVLSKEVVAFIKDGSLKIRPYLKKGAIVAEVSGFKKVVLDAIIWFVEQDVSLFDDAQEAKDWLVGG